MNMHAMRSIAAVGLALFLGASTPAEATPIFSEGEAKPNRFWWPNQLDPAVSKAPFTVDEVRTILVEHHRRGNRWAKIDMCIGKLTEENGD